MIGGGCSEGADTFILWGIHSVSCREQQAMVTTNLTPNQGRQWEVIKNAGLHFVVSLCVRSTCAKPQRGQDRSSKRAEGEEYVLR